MAAAVDEELAAQLPPRSDEAIVGLVAIARLIGKSNSGTQAIVNGEGFPVSVATIDDDRAWLQREVRAWQRDLGAPPRVEGEMQQLFIDHGEMEKRVGLNSRTLWRMIRAERWDRVPKPEGTINQGGYDWRREKVEVWEVSTAGDAARGRATASVRRGRPRARAHGCATSRPRTTCPACASGSRASRRARVGRSTTPSSASTPANSTGRGSSPPGRSGRRCL